MSSDDPGSISRWLEGLKAGRADAADAIWQRYYRRVLAEAQRRLRSSPHQAVEDGEDVALGAFQDLYAGAARGQFDRLRDRAELWQLLRAIAAKKVLQHRRRHGRLKRGGQVSHVPASAADRGDEEADFDADAVVLALIADKEPPRRSRSSSRSSSRNSSTPCPTRSIARSPAGESRGSPTPRSPGIWAARSGPSSGRPRTSAWPGSRSAKNPIPDRSAPD